MNSNFYNFSHIKFMPTLIIKTQASAKFYQILYEISFFPAQLSSLLIQHKLSQWTENPSLRWIYHKKILQNFPEGLLKILLPDSKSRLQLPSPINVNW